jgi:hypothetical protein
VLINWWTACKTVAVYLVYCVVIDDSPDTVTLFSLWKYETVTLLFKQTLPILFLCRNANLYDLYLYIYTFTHEIDWYIEFYADLIRTRVTTDTQICRCCINWH